METVLLLFDEDHPCWTGNLINGTGENPKTLKLLHESGMVQEEDGIFYLTDAGKEAYRRAARECFYNIPPGTRPADLKRSVERTRLEQLLDRAFLGRWGIKEFRPGAKLPHVPNLSGRDLFDLSKGSPRWTYGENPGVRELLKKYPQPSRPDAPLPDLQEFETWLRKKRISYGHLELDLLFLHHYDSEHFKDLPLQPNDTLRLYHTDRFFFQIVLPGKSALPTLLEGMGRFHLFLITQRRIFLPWFFNRDSTDYDAVNWWFWVTETEAELVTLRTLIGPLSEELVAPALPLELFGISMEALEQVKVKREYHWDLFEEIAVPLSRRL